MTTIKKALQEVGFRPSKKIAVKATLKQLVDDALYPIAKPRPIQVQRAGGYYKARFAGQASFTFGDTPEDAEEKLRCGRLGRFKVLERRYGKFAD